MSQTADESLPDAVSRRAAGYAAEALRAMQANQVPPALRFAMKHRGRPPSGRLIETVRAALNDEPEFREQVGAAVGQSDPLARVLAADPQAGDDPLDRGEDPIEADPVGAAALLFLIRPDGWRDRLAAAIEAIPASAPALDETALQRELGALRAKLRRSEERRELDVGRARQAEQQARSQLSEESQRLRDQLKLATAAAAGSLAQAERLGEQVADLELQLRRLQGQVEKLTKQADSDRTALRGARTAATARTKVLLEVLADAVAGLRDELVFPSGVPRPADLVEAREPARGSVPGG